jgi:nucleotide-binding universal stress UspA family protein
MFHLLAATDFSTPAARALDRASALAALHHDASLTVMHVQPIEGLEVVRQMFAAEVEEAERGLLAAAESELAALSAKHGAALGRGVSTELSQGNPSAEIVGAASRLCADLIVMGDRGTSGGLGPFLGGTIERVLQATNRSVLAVKQPAAGPYRKVLVGVSSASECSVAAELAFALNPGAEIILFHAFEPLAVEKFRRAGADNAWLDEYRTQHRTVTQQDLERLAARLDEAGIRTRRIVAPGPPVPTIVEHSVSLAADLIVVGRNRRSILGDLLFGNVARHVTMEATVDVLVASSLPDLRKPAPPDTMA